MEIVDNEKYDMKKHKCNLNLIIDFQYLVRSLLGMSEFNTMFRVAHFILQLLIRNMNLQLLHRVYKIFDHSPKETKHCEADLLIITVLL